MLIYLSYSPPLSLLLHSRLVTFIYFSLLLEMLFFYLNISNFISRLSFFWHSLSFESSLSVKYFDDETLNLKFNGTHWNSTSRDRVKKPSSHSIIKVWRASNFFPRRIINLTKIRRCIHAYQRWLALDAFDGKTYARMRAHFGYMYISARISRAIFIGWVLPRYNHATPVTTQHLL